ncbi:MAG: nucleotide exchange factor GrpE [Deltaproteobacteria bacterium]|nr:nucleotide exchange factor GrpE [Deltaproteobacteria bacterium]
MRRKKSENHSKTYGEAELTEKVEKDEADQEQEPSDPLEEAKKEAADNYDRFVRLSADFENYKKRNAKDRADLLKYCNEKLIRDILPIVDSIDRALEHSSNSKDLNAFIEGLRLIQGQLSVTMEKNGVEKIDTTDRNFDPNYHEAMLQVETDDRDADNKIADVFETGYLLKGRLLRPAKVSILRYSKEMKKSEQ